MKREIVEMIGEILMMIGIVIALGALGIGGMIMGEEFMTMTSRTSVLVNIFSIGILILLEGVALRVLMYL